MKPGCPRAVTKMLCKHRMFCGEARVTRTVTKILCEHRMFCGEARVSPRCHEDTLRTQDVFAGEATGVRTGNEMLCEHRMLFAGEATGVRTDTNMLCERRMFRGAATVRTVTSLLCERRMFFAAKTGRTVGEVRRLDPIAKLSPGLNAPRCSRVDRTQVHSRWTAPRCIRGGTCDATAPGTRLHLGVRCWSAGAPLTGTPSFRAFRGLFSCFVAVMCGGS